MDIPKKDIIFKFEKMAIILGKNHVFNKVFNKIENWYKITQAMSTLFI